MLKVGNLNLTDYLLEDLGSLNPQDQIDELTEILARLVSELAIVLPQEAIGRVLGVAPDQITKHE